MGLDLLDITFRIEEEFEIDLSSDDLDGIVRDRDIIVGDLGRTVCAGDRVARSLAERPALASR